MNYDVSNCDLMSIKSTVTNLLSLSRVEIQAVLPIAYIRILAF